MATPSEMPAAALVPLLGLVGYQEEGATVSRILLRRAGGTITLLAFDAGQSLSEPTAPFDVVAHVLEGNAEITFAGTPISVSPGDGADARESAARGPGAHAVQDAADDDEVGLTGTGSSAESRSDSQARFSVPTPRCAPCRLGSNRTELFGVEPDRRRR